MRPSWIQHMFRAHNAGKNIGSMAIAGPVPGWKTKTHKRFISKDRLLLKQLEEAQKGSEQSSTFAGHLIPLVVHPPLRHRNRSLSEPATSFLFADCSTSRTSESIPYHPHPFSRRICIILRSIISDETIQHD